MGRHSFSRVDSLVNDAWSHLQKQTNRVHLQKHPIGLCYTLQFVTCLLYFVLGKLPKSMKPALSLVGAGGIDTLWSALGSPSSPGVGSVSLGGGFYVSLGVTAGLWVELGPVF